MRPQPPDRRLLQAVPGQPGLQTAEGSVIDLAAGESESMRQDLSIKCVDDADIEIHYTTSDGDFTQVFENRDISDKNAVLTLTNH